MNQITITEDQALSLDKSLSQLIVEKELEGYKTIHMYQHPAVGTVVVMEKKLSIEHVISNN
jgi:hypothetical protein